ncbi:YggS family pyridoxal phosphate-dependent enzyme [Psychrosphaera ytuae]|uniref:Pyridoxal phosphate homeostasis protein n=1 Tax=Psychrosphaera ytuae TaxID=2820710 RepID=A0A975DE33_9GAMM|nr:YggS family pyridoxal phosphate-dependent enzyme [Psychrosphaera ytuae]QTH63955.1 YggS family pyridoxal phosphate-dependent enzyme [Psychrosphaera ytuae]
MSEKELTNTIAERLGTAHEKISSAVQQANRPTDSVKLMAVSKTKPVEYIVAAYQQGQRIFGENYAQELAEKAESLNEYSDIEWHFIGPIQSNKTAIIAKAADWVDSVDREKIAKRLQNHALELNKTLNILLQVNISNSSAKSGVLLQDVDALAKQVDSYSQLNLRGLMAIPDQYDDNKQLIEEFEQMQACFLRLQQQYSSVDTLSLGMSGDMQPAIQAGSTMVRLGTAIFGQR